MCTNNIAKKSFFCGAMHKPTRTSAKCCVCFLAGPILSGIAQAPERFVLLCYSSLVCLVSLPANPLLQAASKCLPFQHVSDECLAPVAAAHVHATPLKQAPVKLQENVLNTWLPPMQAMLRPHHKLLVMHCGSSKTALLRYITIILNDAEQVRHMTAHTVVPMSDVFYASNVCRHVCCRSLLSCCWTVLAESTLEAACPEQQ